MRVLVLLIFLNVGSVFAAEGCIGFYSGTALNEIDKAAIRTYTGGGFKLVNPYLRGESIKDINRAVVFSKYYGGEAIRKMINGLRVALSKIPYFHGTAYRAIDVPLAEKGDDHWYDYSFVDSFVKGLGPGSILVDKAFLSASKLKAGAGDAEDSILRLKIKSQTGRAIHKFSHEIHEREILFLPDTKFRTLSIRGYVEAPTKRPGRGGARWNRNFFTHYYDDFFKDFDKSSVAAKISRGSRVPYILIEVEELNISE